MMRKEHEILFSLLRSALWGAPVKNLAGEAKEEAGEIPWNEILSDAKKQTVLGLVCDAVQSIPKDCQPPADILTRLISFRVLSIKTHSMLNARLAEVLDILRNEGIEPILFKGQGLAGNYPEPTARQCGDIDLYVGGPDYEKACQIAIRYFGEHEHDSESIKHYHLKYKEVDVELHRIAESLPGFFANRNYQQWTLNHLHGPDLRRVQIGDAQVNLPPHQFDCIYILNHLWHHFINGGIGLRQVCDWAMYLHRFHKDIDTKTLEKDLRAFRLRKVWELFSDIAVRYLGLPAQECPLYKGKISKRSETVLEMIFEEGNFGKFSEHRSTPRPAGYTAGKLHSLKLSLGRYFRLLRVFPIEAFRCFFHYFINGVYHYFRGLI